MKNLQNYTTDNLERLSGNSTDNKGAFTFIGYSNGKHRVIYNSSKILSEGLWSANNTEKGLTAGTVVSIKECAYRTYEDAYAVENTLSDLIIVERPVWSSFTVETEQTGGGYLPIGDSKVF